MPRVAALLVIAAICALPAARDARSQTASSDLPPAPAAAATPEAAPEPAARPPLPVEELDQLLAPVALYPDPLVAQILMAATYPLEVVEADRWVREPDHAGLKGEQLVVALAPLPWDPSIKSLVPFPRILAMMDSRLDWTEALGDAFLAQEASVMDTVQRLRQRAEAAGSLRSTPHEAVGSDGAAVTITPVDQYAVYVPMYNPATAYGAWPWPAYPPVSLPPPPDFAYDNSAFEDQGLLWWDVPIIVPLWGWCEFRWRDHRIDRRPGRFHGFPPGHPAMAGGGWQHDPDHRRGVPYRDPVLMARFGRAPAPFSSAPLASAPLPQVFRGGSAGSGARTVAAVVPGRPVSMPMGMRPTMDPRPAVERPVVQRPNVVRPSIARPTIARPSIPQVAPPSFNAAGAGREVHGEAPRGPPAAMPAHGGTEGFGAVGGFGRGR